VLLQIAELVIGVICVILGAVVSGIVGETKRYYEEQYYLYQQSNYNGYYPYYRYSSLFTTGEGIWCGVWVRNIINMLLNMGFYLVCVQIFRQTYFLKLNSKSRCSANKRIFDGEQMQFKCFTKAILVNFNSPMTYALKISSVGAGDAGNAAAFPSKNFLDKADCIWANLSKIEAKFGQN